MILYIAKLLVSWFGLDLQKAQRYVIYGVMVLLAVVVLVLAVSVRSCLKKPAKLNEVEIQRGEQAVKEQNDKELKEILINSDAREKIADATAANGTADKEAIVEESRRTWGNANRSELQAEFDRRRGN